MVEPSEDPKPVAVRHVLVAVIADPEQDPKPEDRAIEWALTEAAAELRLQLQFQWLDQQTMKQYVTEQMETELTRLRKVVQHLTQAVMDGAGL